MTVPAPSENTVRCMTWNLLLGGLDDGNSDRLLDQLTLISAYAPDVLCLPEAARWHEQDDRLLHLAEDATGLKTAMLARSATGQGVNATALMFNSEKVRLVGEPVRRAEEAFHHALIRAVFRPAGVADEGGDFVVLATHLNPFDPGARLGEARWMTDYAGQSPKFPPRAVLLGDLNTPDREPVSWTAVPTNLHSRYRLVLNDGSFGAVDRRAVRALLNSGWRDPHDLLGLPRQPTVGHFFPTERVPWALDYALVAGLDVRQVFTHPFSTGFTLSDHLPHFMDIALPA